MKKLVAVFIFISLMLFNLDFAFAHGGGLDTYGCHHNRKQGGYHCHRGPFAGESFSSKEEMLMKLEESKKTQEEKQPSQEGEQPDQETSEEPKEK